MGANGYAWWYIDALSDDGQHALTLIAFLGSVFSPYYAAARRRGPADPLNHVALNVALHRPGGHRWAMTERGSQRVTRNRQHLCIGPSQLAFDGHTLNVEINEVCVPWPRALRGRLRLQADGWNSQAHALDAAGLHHWRPLAPAARISVEFDAPACNWQGNAYFDANTGVRPLECDFAGWQWSRDSLADGGCRIHYDVQRRDGSTLALALQAGKGRMLEATECAALTPLPRTGWRIPRTARGVLQLERTLEDGPFYARSQLRGPNTQGTVHESLSLDRFNSRVVQAMLPFRMPRRA